MALDGTLTGIQQEAEVLGVKDSLMSVLFLFHWRHALEQFTYGLVLCIQATGYLLEAIVDVVQYLFVVHDF